MTSPSSSSLASSPPTARLPLLLRRLGPFGLRPTHGHAGEPLDTLIGTVLSQNTTDANSSRAFQQLKARFPDWEKALAAPPSRIAAAIRSGGLAEVKSLRIKEILRRIAEDRGRLDLGFLRHLPVEAATAYLTSLPGVGPKTAACVLLFSLNRPAFPVDTHVLRVSKRLGVLPPRTTMDRAHVLYRELLASTSLGGGGAFGATEMLDLHMGLVRLGREVCAPRRPRCGDCRLAELCPRLGVGTEEGGRP